MYVDIVWDLFEFRKRFFGKTLAKINDELQDLKDLLCHELRIPFANEVRFRIYLFSESTQADLLIAPGSITLYQPSPSILLGRTTKNEFDDEVLNWLEEILNQYGRGIYHCSRCGNPIQSQQIAGHWYAGVYCQECWQNNIAEQARKDRHE